MSTETTYENRAESHRSDGRPIDGRRTEPTGDGDTVLRIDGVGCSFGSESAVEDVTLSVEDGELLTLLGPSGCGKTTTLRLIAGLERPNCGRIAIDDRVVADASAADRFAPPESRDVGIVFQDFALFPHLTAAENVAFGIDHLDGDEQDRRVETLLDMVGLEAQADSYPEELSGGQQQRVALARALAPEPEVLLLDEPFSNLDVDLRVRMREEVRRILKEAGVTAVFVTHDQEEALSISDRVAVMNDGSLEQVGDPETVFQHPTSRFVAGFIGHASFVPGYVHDDEVRTELGTIGRSRIHGLSQAYDRTKIDLLVRPDDVNARPAEDGNGRVTYRRYLGPSILYRVELDEGGVVECMHNHATDIELDERVQVELTADHDLAWFPQEEHTS